MKAINTYCRATAGLLMPYILGAVACDDGGFNKKELPEIAVAHGAGPIEHNASIALVQDAPARCSISNAGSGTLLIRGIIIDSIPPGAFTVVSVPKRSEEEPVQLRQGSAPHEFAVRHDPNVGADTSAARHAIPTAKLPLNIVRTGRWIRS